ncbi:hypothetical protein CKM354_000417300 [Cercospora kikuchii]|uniref:Chaperone DnaJ C-terminal domain-containing protein n=1 Tax=Cercospora kikuchii TaxID=84275 RepID=A0A9P3CI44_9PEZI|nr:uncharacterized protein CKM354_000417300 [Cercospora kikuchii]GIZ40850.1 hypothetical protein CKM354_000417300 [Cercospora kikuchii]
MRLLNIHTLEFKLFLTEQDRPPYIITSHRWVDHEITFQQFLAHRSDPSICQTIGFQKIRSFCDFVKDWAKDIDLNWIWIDTCSRAANIPEDIIADYKKSTSLSIAQKRSWMDNRSTTRPEDSAYCLLGICGIYLPLIYGEREQAFERLEEAIERRNLKTNTQTPNMSTSRSSSATADQSEIDWSDGEHSEATVNWHEIANKHQDQGNKYYKSGQYEAAIQEYTHAIKTEPRSHIHFGNRAAAFMMMTWYREAIDDCNRALELDPGNRKITERLEKAKATLGQQLGGRSNDGDHESAKHAFDPGNVRVPTRPAKSSRLRRSRYTSRSPSPARAARRSASVGPIRESEKIATKPDIKPEREHAKGNGKMHRDDLYVRETHSAPPQKDGPRNSHFRFSGGAAENPFLPLVAGFEGSSDPRDIFAEFMRGSASDDDDLFANFGCGSGAQKDDSGSYSPPPMPEPKFTARLLPLSLEEIFNGTTKKLKVRRRTYDRCLGTEKIEETILAIPIKPGLEPGSKIKYPDMGDGDNYDGPTDLHFIVKDKPHPLFVRYGEHLEHTIALSSEEAESGWGRIITMIDGKHLQVTKTGRTDGEWTDCYPGLGMPSSKKPETRGDLIIKVKIAPKARP